MRICVYAFGIEVCKAHNIYFIVRISRLRTKASLNCLLCLHHLTAVSFLVRFEGTCVSTHITRARDHIDSTEMLCIVFCSTFVFVSVNPTVLGIQDTPNRKKRIRTPIRQKLFPCTFLHLYVFILKWCNTYTVKWFSSEKPF